MKCEGTRAAITQHIQSFGYFFLPRGKRSKSEKGCANPKAIITCLTDVERGGIEFKISQREVTKECRQQCSSFFFSCVCLKNSRGAFAALMCV